MSQREIIGWALVTLAGMCGIAAAAIKGGLFEALTAASGAFTAAAAMWGVVNKPPAPKA